MKENRRISNVELRAAEVGVATHMRNLAMKRVQLSEDGLGVRLIVGGFREGYVHELSLANIQSKDGQPLL